MKLLKTILVLLLVLMIALSGLSYFYRNTVLDTKPPVIVTDRDVLEVSVYADPDALFEGLTARDERDGDLTDRILVDHVSNLIDTATVRITYVVFDKADNFAKLTRTLHYTDYTGPRFVLNGPLVYTLGKQVHLNSRLSAVDVLDGDVSGNMQIVAQDLNVNQPGLYEVTVQTTNSLGDVVMLPLKLLIQPNAEVPEITLSDYLVYLEKGDSFRAKDYLVRAEDPAEDEEGSAMRLSDVRVSGTVNTDEPGVYTIQFYANGIEGTGYTLMTVVVE